MESLRVQVMLGQVKGEGGWDQEQFIPMELLEVREGKQAYPPRRKAGVMFQGCLFLSLCLQGK